MTNQLVLTVGYDIENLSDPQRRANLPRPRYHRRLWAASSPSTPTAQRI